MSYYETIGVPADASSDKIRRAYRRAISRVHPDKYPGDAEKSKAAKDLIEAYGVLSDPAKRAEYDRSGGKRTGPEDLDDAIKDALAAAFADGIGRDVVDLLAHVRILLTSQISQAADTCVEARRKRNKYSQRRAKIKVDEGRLNIVHELIDDSVRRLGAIIESAEREMAIANAALEELKFYSQQLTEDPLEVGIPSRLSSWISEMQGRAK